MDPLDLLVPRLIPLVIQILIMLFGLTKSIIIRGAQINYNCSNIFLVFKNNIDCLGRLMKFLLFSTSVFNTFGTFTICLLETSYDPLHDALVYSNIFLFLGYFGYIYGHQYVGGLGDHIRNRGKKKLSDNLYVIGAMILIVMALIASIETEILG